ncbi:MULTISPECIES: hypothetical protein [Chryseobacterium]|nr:hypothetical protein [Chryseobacterium lactis]
MAKKTTSSKIGTKASALLRSTKTSAKVKSVAASALSQVEPKKRK